MKVKEKTVELIELFYDLIYVYAISKMTLLIEEPEKGVISPMAFLRYLVFSFVILQAWLYLTNYVNRYGRWKWYEYALTAVNMIAAVYMANTISEEWEHMAKAFNLAMLVMLLCVAAMYLIQVLLKEQDSGAAKNSLTILTVDCLLYLAAFIASVHGTIALVLWLDTVAVLVGAFLPFFIRGKFDISIISFPHLAERFELLTIITFGESIVGITGFFDTKQFSVIPIGIFAMILSLFGSYVVQLHSLCNHHRVERSLRLMFSHYFIVISINLITVDLKLFQSQNANHAFVAGMIIAALLLFYVSIFSDSIYYKEGFSFNKKDSFISLTLMLLGGLPLILLRDSVSAYLIGVLIITGSNFAMLLLKKMKGQKKVTNK
ncbi:MAG: low temperature requirement protein A [Eubacterium sp.]|nr:low temperature requirement protein A [Eubacterium sp.]